ncbi:MAG TPA: nucleoside hydrolase [Thermoanaerobaculia bacterium]|nr:nucleoside hydrolase [Thermoanaerobaculia bacterium]
MPSYIDSDNALGSPFGDVDDAFAIAALLQSPLDVIGIGSVAGNTSEPRAAANNERVASTCGFTGAMLRPAGSAITKFLSATSGPLTIAALGPLTNIAAAIRDDPGFVSRVKEVVIVGANATSRGRWPPLWPHEFNLTKDKVATFALFRSDLPLTFVPLEVACRMRASHERLRDLPKNELTDLLVKGSRRWLRRARILKRASSFPVWDLTAAMYLIEPGLFTWEETTATIASNTHMKFGEGDRPVRLIRSFDESKAWEAFVRRIEN